MNSLKRSLLVGICALLVGLSGCEGISKIDLTRFGRASWQRPDAVVAALHLEPGNHVADIGAGEGYFVSYLRDAVGPAGRVYAVEVDAERVGDLNSAFSEVENVEVIHGEFHDPLLPEGLTDIVLIVNAFHHIENRGTYFERLKSDLAPSGRVAILEPNADLTGILSLFLKEGHASSGTYIDEAMSDAGYRRVEVHDFLPVQLFHVYAPVIDGN